MTTDKAYYYDRAETELRLAQQAADPAVVRAHYQLAGHYLDRVYGDGEPDLLESDAWADPEDEHLRDKADQLAAQLRAAGVIIVEPPRPR